MDKQTILIILMLALAVLLMARQIRRLIRGENTSCCGKSCSPPPPNESKSPASKD